MTDEPNIVPLDANDLTIVTRLMRAMLGQVPVADRWTTERRIEQGAKQRERYEREKARNGWRK